MVTEILLERWWLLATCLIAVQVALIMIWSWRRTPTSGKAVWGFGMLAAALLITSWYVVTPSEAVAEGCQNLALWVASEDIPAIENALAPTFEADGWDRREFVDAIQQRLLTLNIAPPTLSRLESRFPARDRGITTLNAACRIESDEWGTMWVPTRWKITWTRHRDRWSVSGIQTIPIPPFHFKSLQQMLR